MSHKNFLFAFFLIASSQSYVVEENDDLERAPDMNLIRYQLYTRRNPNNWQTLILDDQSSLRDSYFDPTLNTKIYAIGWNNDGWIANSTKDGYLATENCNFITIDWKVVQTSNVRVLNISNEAGLHLAAFIDFLVDYGAPIESFHLMGHSAGTHLAGAAGAAVTSGRIRRITGLDPAAGVFTLNDTDTRLDISDAEFVDIMHTNGGDVSNGGVAFYEPVGHVDFYVNGGRKQPGCPSVEFGCCSHCRAADLFAESITSDVGFISVRCDSYEDYVAGLCKGNDLELMGEHVSLDASGTFYVDTNQEEPWACGLSCVNLRQQSR